MAVCDFVLINSRPMLREWFPLLDEAVEAVEARNGDREVIAADVFAAALKGDVEIRLVRLDEEPVGVLVTYAIERMAMPCDLYVWMLYLRPGQPDVMADVVAELELMAREQACAGVTFATLRMAWERRLAPFGFLPQHVVFRKEVSA